MSIISFLILFTVITSKQKIAHYAKETEVIVSSNLHCEFVNPSATQNTFKKLCSLKTIILQVIMTGVNVSPFTYSYTTKRGNLLLTNYCKTHCSAKPKQLHACLIYTVCSIKRIHLSMFITICGSPG